MSRALVIGVVLGAVMAVSGVSQAAWSGDGSGSGFSRAVTVPAGNQPSALADGRDVNVSWAANTFPDGSPLGGYEVTRYDGSGAAQPIGAACAGSIGGLSCTEASIASGTWRYTVRATEGNWNGPEGPMSAPVTVGAPALSLSPPNPNVTALPTSLSGSMANFQVGETLTFHLDGAAGTEIAGTVDGNPTPAPVPSGGDAAITVTIPAGLSDGAHAVFASASPSAEGASAPFSVTVGAPQLTALQMFDTNANGKVDRVTATFSENIVCTAPCTSPWTLSNVPSGGTLAYVSTSGPTATFTITEGAGAPDTAVGSFTVGLRASASGIRDASGNQAAFGPTAPADKAGPVPIAVSDTNVGTDGKMEAGDTLVVQFSEPPAGASVPSSATVTETAPPPFGNDRLTITGVTNGARVTGDRGYVFNLASSNSYAPSTVSLSGDTVTVTVGGSCAPASGSNACATNIRAGGPGTLVFAAATTITDPAGNAAVGTRSVSIRLF